MITSTTYTIYNIQYTDGDKDDYTHDKIRNYRKTRQKYRGTVILKSFKTVTACNDHEHDIFFIPTKANPNPVRHDYNTKHLAFLMKE